MDKLEKVCPMAQSQGCLMHKCLFFDGDSVLCIFLRQHETILENHMYSTTTLLTALEYRHIFDSLDGPVGLTLLEDAVKTMVVYLEFLGRLLNSPDFPAKHRVKVLKIRLDLERAMKDYTFTPPAPAMPA